MMTGLQVERQNIEARLQRPSNANCRKKRRIIALVFPNLEMNSAKLVFTMRKPFDMMVNLSTRKE